MEFSAQQIAGFLNGRIEGDPTVKVNNFSKIEEGKPGTLTFLANLKYAHYLYKTKASIVLINNDFVLEQPVGATLIRVENAYAALALLLNMVEQQKAKKSGVDSTAYIAPTATVGEQVYIGHFSYIGEGAQIGKGCRIYPNVYIGDHVTIGENCILYPHTTIYEQCVIGNNCILHAGCVIGADGFGFAPEGESYKKIPQLGNVIIEDDVEIGANTCIDRSTMGSTYLRKGVKLDNLVQIAHNTDIGENTVMSAQVGVAGSTKVGQWCMFGGQVGIAGHISIGNKVFLGAQSGVPGSLKDNQTLIGTPPMEQKPYFKSQAIFRRLPDMYKQLSDLQKEVEKLKQER